MRLAIVRQQYNPQGGAERFVTRALAALVQTGSIDVTLLARRWRDDAGWRIRRIDPSYFTRTGRDRGFARAAAACFDEYDLVQSHERIPGAAVFRAGDGVHASWLAQLARVERPLARLLRFVDRYHRYVLGAEAALFRHPRLRCVICNSRMVAADIASRFGVAEEKLVLVHNGVDTEIFHPELVRFRAQFRAAHGIAPDAPLLAFVGSGFLRKGLSTALAALVPHGALHLVVAGADKHLPRYRRHAEQLGIAERVHFLGALADVRPVYGAADAFILPSLYDPFPNACLEALAAGLPVFTSPTCGAAEWLEAGRNGCVVDALDVAGYRSALAEWLGAASRWPEMRAAARRTAEPYTLARMASELEALYRRLLAT
jgi:UDP-glucose:(heptosyl)LPS alpha-1,3-glucosyltransferase